jgi:hypothetical protein
VAVGDGGVGADVGDQQHAEAARGELVQEVEDAGRGPGVEGRGGLVEQEKFRLVGEGAGEGEALALAAGEGRGLAIEGESAETDAGEEGRGVGVGERGSSQARAGGEVREDRPRQHHGLLRHVGDAAAEGLGGEREVVDAVEQDLPRGDGVEARKSPQERGLAAARGALDGHHLASRQREARAPHHLDASALHDEPAAFEPPIAGGTRGGGDRGLHGLQCFLASAGRQRGPEAPSHVHGSEKKPFEFRCSTGFSRRVYLREMRLFFHHWATLGARVRRRWVFGVVAGACLVSCKGFEEAEGSDACKEAGYSIANRTVTCGGDRDTANARYTALFDQYSCVADFGSYVDVTDEDPFNPAPPAPVSPHHITPDEAFRCSVAVRAVSCEVAQANGDTIASWLAASPVCARIFEGPGLGAAGAGGSGG